jgi:hypothetical protein
MNAHRDGIRLIACKIDEQIPSTQLVGLYAALGGHPQPAADPPTAEAGRVQ